jgi:hypothetical protein
MGQLNRSDLGSFHVTERDRLGVEAIDSEVSSESSWSLNRLLIFLAYFVPPFAFFIPFGSVNVRLSVAAAFWVASGLFALFFLDRSEPHRKRLLIAAVAVAGTLLFYVAKGVIGR